MRHQLSARPGGRNAIVLACSGWRPRLSAFDRAAAPQPHQPAKGGAGEAAEQRLLADEAQRQADRPLGEQPDHEVPVGRVRIDDQDAARLRRRDIVDSPSEQPQHEAGKRAQHQR